jgi:hypothetical protein
LFENGQAVKTGLGSTKVTVSLGSSAFSVRAAVAPPKPPPTTTTRPPACAEAIDGAARLAAAVSFRKVRRVAMAYSGCAANQAAMASIC